MPVTLFPDSESPEPPPGIAGKLSGLHVSSVGSLVDFGRRAGPVPEECTELRQVTLRLSDETSELDRRQTKPF